MTDEQRIIQEQCIIDLTEIENKLYNFLEEYKISNDCKLRDAWCIIYTNLQERQPIIEN